MNYYDLKEDSWDNVSQFPSKYVIDNQNYELNTEMLIGAGFPAVYISALTKEGKKLSVYAKLEKNTCLNFDEKDKSSKIMLWWDTESKLCKAGYIISLTVEDEYDVQVDVLDLNVFLKKNGETCMLDAI